LITASALGELEGLASIDLRRRVVRVLAELAAGAPAVDRLTTAGLCRRREAGLRVLYRVRGTDVVICALGIDGAR
jgi:hypothetical protein